MSEPLARSPQRRGISHLVRPVVLTVMLAGLFALLHPLPAQAHIAGAGGSPTDNRATVTSLRPATSAVEVTVGIGGQWVRVTDRGAGQIVVLGKQGEPFLQLAGNRVQVNERSRTAAESGLVPRAAPAGNPATGVTWVPRSDGDQVSWADPRITAAPGRGESASWELPLIVDGQRVGVLGTTERIPPSSPWAWVAALVLMVTAVSALGWVRNWRRTMAAVVTAGVLAFVAHLVGTGFAPQENGAVFAWVGIAAVGGFALLIGAVAVQSTLRGKAAAPERVVMAGIMVLILAATDITVLWNSQLPFGGPPALDRVLTVLTYAAALGMLVAGLRLVGRQRQAGAEAVESGADAPETSAPGTSESEALAPGAVSR
ncbi:MAG TPA: hypothetical protein VHH34_14995 [Pseudonocardiaceae bacterium]|nr:hypothetical protein [Pseudonocardiaceae bacterium]